MMNIRLEKADQPDVMQLIEELDAYQMPLYPAESHHGIDIQALVQANVLFAVLRDENETAFGCGAVVVNANYGELKRMFIRPTHRGRGASKHLLTFLEQEATQLGCRHFTLETGIHQHEALGLYERCGYVRCGPFGEYLEDPMSVFMQKCVR